jgi:oxygen-independent coproporphyrinogen-3 oxidase
MNSVAGNLVFDPQIIRRFDINGPRYTSYPTADRFVEAFGCGRLPGSGSASATSAPSAGNLSLYFHIPFCNTICYYCACNKIITKDHGRSAKYLKYLAKELALQSSYLEGGDQEVAQLHWGGGTPTFLSHDEMRQLMAATRRHFRLIEGGEYSIEVDPRKVDRATVELLGELGFNRMSVGVQDFDASVQQAVNRIQSEEETCAVIDAARSNGFKSISIDLIYGLPKQTVTGFGRTLDRVIAAGPDRVSIYNYAHLPSLFKPQRRILEADMPSADARLQILSLAIRKMTEAGYVYIGMDHFAKPDDELAGAATGAAAPQLSGVLDAFGLRSAGLRHLVDQQGRTDLQSEREDARRVLRLARQRHLPVYRGIELNADDLLRRSIIQSLMCHFELSIESIEIAHLIDFRQYFATELDELDEMVDAGLVRVDDKWITVLPRGRMLVRAISMVFDRYLRADRQRTRYSKVI